MGGFRQHGRTESVVVADFNYDVRSMSSWRPTPAWTVHNLSNLPEEFYGNGPPPNVYPQISASSAVSQMSRR